VGHFEGVVLGALGPASEAAGLARHADGEALLEATELAAVAAEGRDLALLLVGALVVHALGDAAAEEALAALAAVHAVVEARRLVPAHPTRRAAAHGRSLLLAS